MIKIYSYLVIGYDVLMYWYSKDINYEIIFKCFFYIYYFPIFQVKYRLLICGKFIGEYDPASIDALLVMSLVDQIGGRA